MRSGAAHSSGRLDLIAAIDRFTSTQVLILGDVMLDEYLTGNAERISPEAPVPVVRVEASTHLAGGAGNVALNISALGGRAILIGARGNDVAGDDLEHCIAKENITPLLLPLDKRQTTIKTRILARQQQVIRIDRESSGPLTESQNKRLLERVAESLPSCGAVVVSDYGKGVISRKTMAGLHKIIAAAGRSIPVLVDPKPQNISLYKGVTLLTPNAKETGESVNMPVKTPREILRAGRAIMQKLGCRHLVTTLGSRGMAVFESRDNITHIPTTAQQVFDVTGAGDTVIATLALASAAGLSLVPACLLANYAAGIVVGKVGAATARPNQLAEAVATLPEPALEVW